jgi:hypothetical protein
MYEYIPQGGTVEEGGCAAPLPRAEQRRAAPFLGGSRSLPAAVAGARVPRPARGASIEAL